MVDSLRYDEGVYSELCGGERRICQEGARVESREGDVYSIMYISIVSALKGDVIKLTDNGRGDDSGGG